jgi:hypothetical protein
MVEFLRVRRSGCDRSAGDGVDPEQISGVVIEE